MDLVHPGIYIGNKAASEDLRVLAPSSLQIFKHAFCVRAGYEGQCCAGFEASRSDAYSQRSCAANCVFFPKCE